MVLRNLTFLISALLFSHWSYSQCSGYKIYANDSVGCINDIFSFRVHPSPPAGSVLDWDFETKSVTNDPNPTVALTQADTITCKVQIKLPSSSGTCNLERKDYIIIAADPTLGAVSSTKTEICGIGDKATLSVASNAGSFTWSVDGTVYANRGKSVQHGFQSAGYKQVQIVAEGRFGCTSTRIYDSVLLVLNKPTVTLDPTQLILCGPSNAKLDPSFTFFGNNSFSYDWELKGSSKVQHTTQLPSEVRYNNVGSHDVELTINSNITSCSYNFSFPSYVKVENAPDIKIRATPLNGAGCKSKVYGLSLLGTGLDTNLISWFHNHGDTIEIEKVKADTVVISSQKTGTYEIWAKYSLATCDKLVKVSVDLETNEILADFDDDIPCICNIPKALNVANKSVSLSSKTLTYDWEVRNVKKGKLLHSSNQKDLNWTVDRYGNFNVRLRATDSDGCYEEKTHLVEARPFNAETRINPSVLCPGRKVRFEPMDTMCYESFDSVYWTIYDVDGTTILDQENDLVHNYTFTDTGFYDVNVMITTTNGCRDTLFKPDEIHVTELRGIKLDYDNSQPYCLGEGIKVTADTRSSGINGDWYGFLIGDGYTDTVLPTGNIMEFYPQRPGGYDLKVVFISKTCEDSVYLNDVFEVGGVIFDFTPDDPNGCLPFSTTLRSNIIENKLVNSSDPTLTYEWEISPARIGTLLPTDEPNADLSVLQRGKVTVVLRVTNSDNCITQLEKKDLFKFDLRSNFSLPNQSCTGLGLEIANTSKGSITKAKWSTDAPSAVFTPSDTEFEPTITFNKAGSYKVRLDLEDANGCKDSFERDINIARFKFGFSVDDNIPKCSPASFTFTSTGINVDSFFWNFGDDEPLVRVADSVYLKVYDLTRVVPYRNNFDVTLYAQNSIGCLDSIIANDLITVRGPVPDFEFVNKVGCSPHEVEFINKSISTKKVFFDFGDNSSIDSVNFKSHVYKVQDPENEFEIFRPFVVVHDEFDCKLNYMPDDSILVYSQPIAKFGHTPERGCDPHTVSFSDSSKFAHNWIWHYGDGDSLADSSRNTSRTYPIGTYRPYLVVTNAIGCHDTVKIANRVESLKNPRALFNISDTITCIGLDINFRDSSKSTYRIEEWKWDFGDPDKISDTSRSRFSTYAYDSDGNYDVSLVIVDSNGCTDTLVKENAIRIYQELPIELPMIDYVDVVRDLNVELKFDAAPAFAFGSYILHEVNGLRTDEQINKRKDTALTIRDVFVDDNQYCFNIELIDKCDFRHPGDTHCTVLLQVDPAQTEITHLSWTPYEGWDSILNYTVYRGLKGRTLDPLAVLTPNATSYIDSTVCSEEYEYAVKAMRHDDSLLSSSNYVDYAPQYVFQLDPLEAELATVRKSAVHLHWEKSIQRNVKTYIIDRRASNNLWINGWKRTTDTFFIDSSARVRENSYLYRVKVVDQCEYQSEKSNIATSILLEARPTDRDYRLFWNSYRKWSNGVAEYIVQRRSQAGAPFRTMAVLGALDTNFLDTSAFLLFKEAFSYRVLAVENDTQADTSYSNVRTVEPIPTLFVPSAFSPNGNGVNDHFFFRSVALLPDSISPDHFEMQIFNRWGERVFYTNNQEEGWDGSFKGVACEQGTYVYVISAEALNGSKVHRKGNITLLR